MSEIQRFYLLEEFDGYWLVLLLFINLLIIPASCWCFFKVLVSCVEKKVGF